MKKTWSTSRAAIIPTHNRHQLLNELVSSIHNDVDLIVVVDNASTPVVSVDEVGSHATIVVIHDDEQPPNLSRLWNVGLDSVSAFMSELNVDTYDVAIFNDDTMIPTGWFDDVTGHLRAHPTAAVASRASHGSVGSVIEKLEPDSDLAHRMCPWAFVTRGELSIRADETIRWWWGDTDFDWQARQRGGVLIIPGEPARNALANSSTVGALAEQAGRDREAFARKWGYNPW